MGLFDKFKKKPAVETPPEEELEAPGWDAITAAFEKLYPDQKSPKHYGTLIKWRFGGNDPLDGISIYETDAYWHFVTYGLSELYEKETEDKEYSGYGMEFTFKLKKTGNANEEAEIRCICGILQSIARVTFTKGELFYADEYLYTGQTTGIDSRAASNITGFITAADPALPPIDTPFGRVEFVEFIGATDAELRAVIDKELTVLQLREKLGTDITCYDRPSVV